MSLRRLQLWPVVAAACVLAWVQGVKPGALLRAENALYDQFAQRGRTAAPDPRLVFLGIDDASVGLDPVLDLGGWLDPAGTPPECKRALDLMSKGWPWSREVHGLILRRLVAAGASAVVFDLTFPKPSPNDLPFAQALEEHRDRALLAANITSLEHASSDNPVLTRPTMTLIPAAGDLGKRVGFDNFFTDEDHVVRAAHFSRHTEWTIDDADLAEKFGLTRYFSLAAQAVRTAGLDISIPTHGKPMPLRFAGGAGTFLPRSVYEIFVPEYWKRSFASGEFFRGKIVVIGASGNWQQDEHMTAWGIMPGPEIHLNSMNALLHGEFIQTLPIWLEMVLVLAAAAFGWAMWRGIAQPWVRVRVLVGFSLAWGFLAIVLYNQGLFVTTVLPLLALNLIGGSSIVSDLITERGERRRIRGTLERYVSKNVVQEMLANPEQFHAVLGGVNRPVTILFSDVRNFTSLCATTGPQPLVAQLNEYLEAMVECVFSHGGTLDKFIGDAVMAVWGNAHSEGVAHDAMAAVRCAVAMRAALARLNDQWAKTGRLPLEIGIALHQGEAVIGNVGSPHRMEFTVIGNVVNICWRLQERTKQHDNAILVGEDLGLLVEGEFATERLGTVVVGGSLEVGYRRLCGI